MTIIKLQEAGQSLTERCTTAERVKGQYGEQVKFTLESGDLYVPLDSALRQLERVPMAVEECAGEVLTFSRDPNTSRPGAKPYWGIRLAGAGDRQKPSGKRVESPHATKPLPFDEDTFPSAAEAEAVADPTPPLPPEPEWVRHDTPPAKDAPTMSAYKRKAIADSYLGVLKYVIEHSALTDQQAIQSAAATIFIQWKNAGVV